ncbi:hypothetical protein BGX27_007419 [Mortierella sp. AM989]|nr:hypothetical protein BGX27_007419 [Mortierella sp. AM989]
MLRLVNPQGNTIRAFSRVATPALQQSRNLSHRRLPTVSRTYSPIKAHQFTSKSFSTTSPSLSSNVPPPTPPPANPKKRSLLFRTGRALLIIAAVPVVGTLAYSVYDSFTEYEGDELHKKPPRRVIGGPKNLIMTHGCKGSVLKAEEIHENDPRQRLVILGSGWGAVSVINQLDHKKFHVTVVSPTNYFLFTPLLPSATSVGTLELRSLIEPIRRLLSRLGGYYLEGSAEDIDFENQLVEVSGVNNSEGRKFYVPYDKLVIAVGSASMTHGVEGMEHCNFLKSITDARDIRKKLMENFEKASLPTTTDEERRQLLSFVICGGDLKISEMTEAKFKRENINVITGARVGKVNPTSVLYKDKATGKESEIPFGICLWSTGVGMTPLVKTIVSKLPDSQANRHAIETDAYMRVLGAPKETVYAIGDCATIPQPHFVGKVMDFLKEHDTNNDGVLSYDEFKTLIDNIVKKHSILRVFLAHIDEVFYKYDKDHDEKLNMNEIQAFLEDAEKSCTALPATAQVANQQGKFVGSRINTIFHLENPEATDELPPFEYKHLGSLAYIGGSAAVLDMGKGMVYSGIGSEYMWRSVYFTEQVSTRTRLLLMLDWSKRAVFGRDISKF